MLYDRVSESCGLPLVIASDDRAYSLPHQLLGFVTRPAGMGEADSGIAARTHLTPLAAPLEKIQPPTPTGPHPDFAVDDEVEPAAV